MGHPTGNQKAHGLNGLRKNSSFVSGHDFSRAVNNGADEGFSPWAFLCVLVERHRALLRNPRTKHFVYAPKQGLKPNSLLALYGLTKVVP
jgi:hypothetical protein